MKKSTDVMEDSVRPFRYWLTFIFVASLNLHCGRPSGMTDVTTDYRLPPQRSSENLKAMSKGVVAHSTQIVFLNFEGGTIQPSYWYFNDAQNNTSFIPRTTAQVPAFDPQSYGSDGASASAQLMALLAQEFSTYDIKFTATRPASGNYTMMMVGGTPTLLGLSDNGVVGLSPLDDQNSNPNDVGFIFSVSLARFDPSLKGLSYVIAHELGHTFGLSHNDGYLDIMNPTLSWGNLIWGVGPESENHSIIQDDKVLLLAGLGLANAGVVSSPPPPSPTPSAPPTTPVTPTTPLQTVQNWFSKYLGYASDAITANTYATELSNGMTKGNVLAQILGSDAYFQKTGNKYVYFVPALYQDVTGKSAPRSWINSSLNQLRKNAGPAGREQVARQLLASVRML